MNVLAQQVSVAAAGRLGARLVQAAGADGRFPRPETLGTWEPDRLAATLGMPRQRAVAVLAVARAVADGDLDLSGGADPRDVEDRLLALPGIGPWTAAEVRLRALRDPDVWPPGTWCCAGPWPRRRRPRSTRTRCGRGDSYAAHQVWAHAPAPPPSPSPPAPTPPAPS